MIYLAIGSLDALQPFAAATAGIITDGIEAAAVIALEPGDERPAVAWLIPMFSGDDCAAAIADHASLPWDTICVLAGSQTPEFDNAIKAWQAAKK